MTTLQKSRVQLLALDKGYILIVVLGFLILISAMIVDMTQRARLGSAYLTNAARIVEHRLASEAAIALGLSELIGELKTMRSAPSSLAHEFELGSTHGEISIEDEGGKLDINFVTPDVLQRLMELVGIDSGRAGDIVSAIMTQRAKSRTGRNGSRSGRDKGSAFRSLDELLTIDAMRYEDFQTLRPYLTVYSGKRQVNPWSASELVLRSLKGADESKIVQFVAERDELRRTGPISFASGFGRLAELSQISLKAGPAFTIRCVLDTSDGRGFVQERLYWVSEMDPRQYKLLRVTFPPQQKGQVS